MRLVVTSAEYGIEIPEKYINILKDYLLESEIKEDPKSFENYEEFSIDISMDYIMDLIHKFKMIDDNLRGVIVSDYYYSPDYVIINKPTLLIYDGYIE